MKISKITRTAKNNKRCNVFIDEIYKFTCECRFLEENGIFADIEISDDELIKLEKKLFYKKSLDYTLSILSRKDYTEKQIYDKLLKRDVPENTIKEIVEYLKDMDFLNERRFIENYINYLLQSAKYSLREIKIKIYKKQFSKENSDIADSLLSEADELKIAEKIIKKITNRKSEEQIMIYLSRKGFSYNIVKKAFKNFNEEES